MLSLCMCVCVFMGICVLVFVHGRHLLVTFNSTSYNSCVFVHELIAVTSCTPS